MRLLLAITLSISLLTGYSQNEPRSLGASTQSGIDPQRHILAAGDVLELKVYQEDELNAKPRVDQDGTINLPLLGNLHVGGKTLQQAKEQIEKALREDYLHNPQITLTVAEFAKKRFAVLGQVSKPGYFEMPPEGKINLLQAIAMAGGYSQTADPSKVTVRRTENGKETVIRLNAKTMAREGNGRVFELQPDDTVTVAQSIF